MPVRLVFDVPSHAGDFFQGRDESEGVSLDLEYKEVCLPLKIPGKNSEKEAKIHDDPQSKKHQCG
jgi:hypothetical protein